MRVWETLDPGDRERLKWVGALFRKPRPGRFMRVVSPPLAAWGSSPRHFGLHALIVLRHRSRVGNRRWLDRSVTVSGQPSGRGDPHPDLLQRGALPQNCHSEE